MDTSNNIKNKQGQLTTLPAKFSNKPRPTTVPKKM